MTTDTADRNVFAPLETVLAKMHPIESLAGALPKRDDATPPRFCWSFFRPSPDSYERVEEAVRSFKGHLKWNVISVGGQRCIVPLKDRGVVGYPPVEIPLSGAGKNKIEWDNELVSRATRDLVALAQHVEQKLSLESLSPQPFEPSNVSPSMPAFTRDQVIDFEEPGMHVIWLAEEPREFAARPPKQKSATGKMLHFGVTFEEWREIHNHIAAINSGESTNNHLSEKYSMLLRIQDYESTAFDRSDIGILLEQSLEARSSIASSLARRGLDKLILTCYWAQTMKSGIYLMGP
jgi:hypothetical protein